MAITIVKSIVQSTVGSNEGGGSSHGQGRDDTGVMQGLTSPATPVPAITLSSLSPQSYSRIYIHLKHLFCIENYHNVFKEKHIKNKIKRQTVIIVLYKEKKIHLHSNLIKNIKYERL